MLLDLGRTNMAEIDFRNMHGIAETLLIPLYIRAMESRRPDALIKDDRAVMLIKQIDYDFSRLRLEGHDHVAIILRNREFDRHARDFLARCPEAVVVHIGCGLDSRFERVDNGQVEWYDLDLPEVIDLRRKFIGGEGPRYHLLGYSVFDSAWLEMVSTHHPRPFLFLAEGVLMYFEEAQVKLLVLALRNHFPGSELVCDAETPFGIWANNFKLSFSRVGARLRWGLKHSRDLESWGDDISMVDEWFYIDCPEPRLGVPQWARHFPFLSKASGIFHYQLGEGAR
jgi:O-methyltransferase involved in polyketide biosynthesis